MAILALEIPFFLYLKQESLEPFIIPFCSVIPLFNIDFASFVIPSRFPLLFLFQTCKCWRELFFSNKQNKKKKNLNLKWYICVNLPCYSYIQ